MDTNAFELPDLAPLSPTITQPNNNSQTSVSILNPLASEFLPKIDDLSITGTDAIEPAEPMNDIRYADNMFAYSERDSGISGMSTPDIPGIDIPREYGHMGRADNSVHEIHLNEGYLRNSERGDGSEWSSPVLVGEEGREPDT
ncbi:Fc.00g042550.m01.CDS01 [Cosmosporella sp. VM-42]